MVILTSSISMHSQTGNSSQRNTNPHRANASSTLPSSQASSTSSGRKPPYLFVLHLFLTFPNDRRTMENTSDPSAPHWNSKATVNAYLEASGVPYTSYVCPSLAFAFSVKPY